MTARDIQEILENTFNALSDRHVCDEDCRAHGPSACGRTDVDDFKDELDADATLNGASVTDYESGGYMTRDAGMVLTLQDGSEFQITIVRTRAPLA